MCNAWTCRTIFVPRFDLGLHVNYNGHMNVSAWKIRVEDASPLRIIEYIIAGTSILSGLFLLSPYWIVPIVPITAGPIVEAIVSRPGVAGLGITAILSGAFWIYGLVKDHFFLHTTGIFLNAMARLYATIGNWLAAGEIAWPWSPSVVILLIVIILYMYYRIFTGRDR